MARLTLEEIQNLVILTLERCGTKPQAAASVAEALAGAEAVGQAGHGLRRLPSYAAQVLAGKVDGHACPSGKVVRPGLFSVDAAHGFAYPALDLAVEWLIAETPRQGIAAAGLYRSHHCGVAGLGVEKLAKTGLVGLMFANTPAAMAPWGGAKPVFGTNPIAFAAPLGTDQPSVVVDVSLSKVARGKIMAAKQKGEPIPEGWARDSSGHPTTDPGEALSGSMVPLGDAKGTALALMVELLAAGLTGGRFAAEATSFLDDKGDAPATGQLLIAIDASALSPDAIRRMALLAAEITGMEGARLPGARREELRAHHATEGVIVDDALLSQISGIP